jgi:hypothetical protein
MIHIDLDEDGVADDVDTYGQQSVTGIVDLVKFTLLGRRKEANDNRRKLVGMLLIMLVMSSRGSSLMTVSHHH